MRVIGNDYMNFCGLIENDIANGIGVRVSLFVSGCTNRCKGCFQPETWDFNYGKEFTPAVAEHIIVELSKLYYHGITILGGEPFEEINQRGIVDFISDIRERLPDKSIWVYSGFTYDKDLVPGGKRYITDITDKILDNIDVLVDGKFILEQKQLGLRFRGSKNQRIIDMRKTRSEGHIVLSEYN